jgi:hypothetical protein
MLLLIVREMTYICQKLIELLLGDRHGVAIWNNVMQKKKKVPEQFVL